MFVFIVFLLPLGKLFKPMDIGKALRETRQKQGLRQNHVAAKTKISATYISQIEQGKKMPSLEIVEKLSKFYKVPIAVLMWKSIDVKDVQPHKREAFSRLSPTINDMINCIF